jgi:hypothetical protein
MYRIKKSYILLFTYGLLATCELCWAGNPVVIGNARFTFITAGLVRMEYALSGKFVNDSTMFAVNRSVRYDSIKVEEKGGGRRTLSTPLMRVEYSEHGFPPDIMVFDMGWHTQKEATAGTGHAGNTGWTGYTPQLRNVILTDFAVPPAVLPRRYPHLFQE